MLLFPFFSLDCTHKSLSVSQSVIVSAKPVKPSKHSKNWPFTSLVFEQCNLVEGNTITLCSLSSFFPDNNLCQSFPLWRHTAESECQESLRLCATTLYSTADLENITSGFLFTCFPITILLSLQALADEMDAQNERLGWLNKYAPQILASPSMSPQSREQHVGKLRVINLSWSKVRVFFFATTTSPYFNF